MTGATVVVGGVAGACIVFSSVFVLMRILAWVLTNGLPHMFRVRAQAVVEWQDCDVKDRDDWDYESVEVLARIVADACEAEPDPDAEHFQLWHAEVTGRRRVRRALRRMERWSR